MRGLSIHDTEYLKSVFVAVAKSQVEQFENEIYTLGNELVGYGGELDLNSFTNVSYIFVNLCS